MKQPDIITTAKDEIGRIRAIARWSPFRLTTPDGRKLYYRVTPLYGQLDFGSLTQFCEIPVGGSTGLIERLTWQIE